MWLLSGLVSVPRAARSAADAEALVLGVDRHHGDHGQLSRSPLQADLMPSSLPRS
jgi:hypothetical protein